jgi:hypothetical protein
MTMAAAKGQEVKLEFLGPTISTSFQHFHVVLLWEVGWRPVLEGTRLELLSFNILGYSKVL